MRCLGKLFFLALLCAAAAVAGWVLRDRWVARTAPAAPAAPAIAWEPLTPEGKQRAEDSLQRFSQRTGPAFIRLDAGDLAAYMLSALPPSATDVQVAVVGERVVVKASVQLSDIGGASSLGPLGSVLGAREPVEIAGSFAVVRRGLAEFRVAGVKVRDLSLPTAVIPRLIRQFTPGAPPAGVSDNGIPFPVPDAIGDVRIMDGRVVLYRATP